MDVLRVSPISRAWPAVPTHHHQQKSFPLGRFLLHHPLQAVLPPTARAMRPQKRIPTYSVHTYHTQHGEDPPPRDGAAGTCVGTTHDGCSASPADRAPSLAEALPPPSKSIPPG